MAERHPTAVSENPETNPRHPTSMPDVLAPTSEVKADGPENEALNGGSNNELESEPVMIPQQGKRPITIVLYKQICTLSTPENLPTEANKPDLMKGRSSGNTNISGVKRRKIPSQPALSYLSETRNLVSDIQDTSRSQETSTPSTERLEGFSSLRSYEGKVIRERLLPEYRAPQETVMPTDNTVRNLTNSAQYSISGSPGGQSREEAYVPLPIFDGRGDPIEFIKVFLEGLEKIGAQSEMTDHSRHKIFLDSLKGEAQGWSASLPLDGYSFDELQQLFLERYASQIQRRGTNSGIGSELYNREERKRKKVKSTIEAKSYDKKKSSDRFKIHPRRKSNPVNNLKKDPLSWCRYHKITGHKTEECRQLRQHLLAAYGENLIKGKRDSGKKEDDRITADLPGSERSKDVYPHPRITDSSVLSRRINMVTTRGESVGQVSSEPLQAEKEDRIVQKELVFTPADLEGVEIPHGDTLVITLEIADHSVPRILVDTGSSSDIISIDTLQRIWSKSMKINPKMKELAAFGGEIIPTVGTIKLPVSVGGTLRIVEFDIIEKGIVYNVILGTPWLFSMQAVASTFHQCLKFPTPAGIYTVKGSQSEARKCLAIEQTFQPLRNLPIAEHNCPTPEEIPKTIEQVTEGSASTFLDKNIASEKSNKKLCL